MKEITMVGRSGQKNKLSGGNIFGVFTYLYYQGYRKA